MLPCAIKLYRTDVKYACWCLYSSSVLGELTNERLRVGDQRSGMTRAEGKLVCIMPCKEEEDEVKVHEVGRGFILSGKINFINFPQI